MVATSDEAPADPTLRALVPARSRWRVVVLVVLALAVLAAAWSGRPLVRPTVQGAGPVSGEWSVVPASGEVVAVTRLGPDAWPWVDVRDVGGVPGAHAATVWVLGSEDPAAGLGVRADDVADARSYVHALYPAADLDRPDVRVRPHDDRDLVVVWAVDDCAALVPRARPTVTLRTALGISVRQELAESSGPSFDRGELDASGVCP